MNRNCIVMRALTTRQISEAYETNEKVISKNFNNNRVRYVEGKHYIKLTGNELNAFLQSQKVRMQNERKIRVLYLWTEKGALLHAKSINTDKAWEVYDYLVDFYFRVKEEPRQQMLQEHGVMMVDIPDNVKIQEAMKEVGKYLTATEVALKEYNMYRTEESYNNQRRYLTELFGKVQVLFWDMLNIKPETVRKQ